MGGVNLHDKVNIELIVSQCFTLACNFQTTVVQHEIWKEKSQIYIII